MFRRVLGPTVFILLLLLVIGGTSVGPASGTSARTRAPLVEPTSTVPVSLPDDHYTLFPDWSNDNYGYLNPGNENTSIPETGGSTGALAIASAVALVTGTALTVGTRSRR